ncbi:hypothetical protein [Variovorax sp. dw_308]|uniref:hypothetical protein n=1 Tax=Variovorax sp. dw_308 TaxID=2721546 RepID=UPI001C44937D|nr:hypothetical protein [Variovorax sp. dw_308]
MVSSKIPDPLEMWRSALTRMEATVNEMFARQVSSSPQIAKVLDRSTKVTLGLQHVTDKAHAKALARLELPSRSEVQALAAAVQRVEDKLDQLMPATASRPARPPRTRRPAPVAAVATLALDGVKPAQAPKTANAPARQPAAEQPRKGA